MEEEYDYLKRLIFYFFGISKIAVKETKIFNELKHNDDLCPGLTERVDLILSFFQRYRNITYDIQGLRDEGTDVILRYYLNGKAKYICFQLKTKEDLNKKGFLDKIKTQYVDSKSRYDFEDYYIIIATDQKKYADKIRWVSGKFSTISAVTVVDSRQFGFFWKLREPQIGAIIKSFSDKGDLLMQRALEVVKGLLLPQYSLIFYLLDQATRKGFLKHVDFDDITESLYLKEIYENYDWNSDDEELMDANGVIKTIEEDLVTFSELFFEIDNQKKRIYLDYDYLKPLLALILEAQLKYDFDSQETIEYLEQIIFG